MGEGVRNLLFQVPQGSPMEVTLRSHPEKQLSGKHASKDERVDEA